MHVFPFILSISFPPLNFIFDLDVFLGLQIKRIYFILDTYASWNCPLVRFMFQSFDDQMRSFLWSNCCFLSPSYFGRVYVWDNIVHNYVMEERKKDKFKIKALKELVQIEAWVDPILFEKHFFFFVWYKILLHTSLMEDETQLTILIL